MSTSEPLPHSQRHYSLAETIADGVVHGVAILAGLVAFAVLFFRVGMKGDVSQAFAMGVYAAGFFVLFGVSCAYNLAPPSRIKWILRRFDHAAIFLMISGTYTALLSQAPRDAWAWSLALFVWTASLVGAAIAVFLPGRFDRGLLALYLAIGWAGILSVPHLIECLPAETTVLTIVGGVVYSLGVPFHLWNSLKFQNAIWHVFVTIAAACQYVGIAHAIGHGA